MGSFNAAGMKESVDQGYLTLEQAIRWHLGANHFPPVPSVWAPVCLDLVREATDMVEAGESIYFGDDEVDNPVRPGSTVKKGVVFGALHLGSFVG